MSRVSPLPYSLKPVIVGLLGGLLITIPSLIIAVATAGAGHGHYIAARALFPAPLLLSLLTDDTIGFLSISAAVLQFPLYGAALGWAAARKQPYAAVALVVAHALAAYAAFTGTLTAFS